MQYHCPTCTGYMYGYVLIIFRSFIIGNFIGGILKNGDAFLWHKDRDMLKMIPGVPAIAGKLQTKVADESGKTSKRNLKTFMYLFDSEFIKEVIYLNA